MKGYAVVVATAVVLTGAIAGATTVTLSPVPPDMWDLDHQWVYTWGISFPVMPGVEITSATLYIDNVYNTIPSDPNILHVSLLDNPPLGAHQTVYDDQNPSNYFQAMGLTLFSWVDPDSGPPPHDLVHTFNATQLAVLNSYWQDNGVFGFGFDPDCHFANDGITFVFDVPVPEPTSLALLGLGLGSLFIRKRLFSC